LRIAPVARAGLASWWSHAHINGVGGRRDPENRERLSEILASHNDKKENKP